MKYLISSVFIFFMSQVIQAQNEIESKQTAEYYVRNVLLGPGIEIGNINHVGMVGGLGQFKCDSTIIGVSRGLILSTGSVDSVFSNNRSMGYTSYNFVPDSLRKNRTFIKGDKDLNKLCKGKTEDITLIEFDFVPVRNKLEFRYVFGSDEYNEYVGSRYNDVFGFFLSGPGVKGLENLAKLPDGKTPISINTVNNKKNKKFYRDNSFNYGRKKFFAFRARKNWQHLRKSLEYDGITTVLKVERDVEPYRLYHMKIAIGDVSDGLLDSGVFLEAGSFGSDIDSTGKYFSRLEKFALNQPNVDSILHKEKYVVEISMETAEEKAETEANEFRITDIYFDFSSAELTETAVSELTKLADYLQKNRSKKCMLVGYTDNVGSKSFNQKLSEDRAQKVIAFLISQGIENNRLHYSGRNFENARSDNSTETERAQNRRVEIILED